LDTQCSLFEELQCWCHTFDAFLLFFVVFIFGSEGTTEVFFPSKSSSFLSSNYLMMEVIDVKSASDGQSITCAVFYLRKETTEATVREMFGQYGNVRSVKLVEDTKFPRHSRVDVEFSTAAEAKSAALQILTSNGVKGERLSVSVLSPVD
jgi:hypothetical protein